MAVHPDYARTLMGQWVDCNTTRGVYSGVLREVRPDGIVLEMPRSTAGYASGVAEEQSVREGGATEAEYENAFFPFFSPFRFFIPFFLLLALSRRRFFI